MTKRKSPPHQNCHHCDSPDFTFTFAPSTSEAAGAITTCAPALNPEVTCFKSLKSAPVTTVVRFALHDRRLGNQHARDWLAVVRAFLQERHAHAHFRNDALILLVEGDAH